MSVSFTKFCLSNCSCYYSLKMVFIRDKCAFANCVSTKLDFNACKFFNFPKDDNQKWLQACNNEKLKISSSCFQQKLIPFNIQ